MRVEVLIVGAGPAATSTAHALLRRSIPVVIFTTKRSAVGIPVDVLSPDVRPEFAAIGLRSAAWTNAGMAYHLESLVSISISWDNATCCSRTRPLPTSQGSWSGAASPSLRVIEPSDDRGNERNI
jgi:2-polyprenyl-6-methoxyphenol hydroxylase-like FAD-dependent oxidoreductase